MGTKGLVWSAASLGVLLYDGIGDTIRVSLTPRPGGDRREEVYAACELLQSLGLRSFLPAYGLPGMRADYQHDVPGVGGKRSRLHSEYDAHLEDAV